MRHIYHLVTPAHWNAVGAGPYRAESLETEGFIHCSHEAQVARVANLFYADCAELLVLCIDASCLGHPVRNEEAANGERFPHVYGPIERDAIVGVQPLTRDANGHWVFPVASV